MPPERRWEQQMATGQECEDSGEARQTRHGDRVPPPQRELASVARNVLDHQIGHPKTAERSENGDRRTYCDKRSVFPAAQATRDQYEINCLEGQLHELPTHHRNRIPREATLGIHANQCRGHATHVELSRSSAVRSRLAYLASTSEGRKKEQRLSIR